MVLWKTGWIVYNKAMDIKRTFGISDAIQTLAPGAEWVLAGDEYSGLTWNSQDIKKPTKAALEKEVKEIFALITFGAAGAPTLTSGFGVTSITKDATGEYTLVLDSRFPSFKNMSGTFEKSTGEDIRMQLKSESVNSSSKSVSFFTLTGASATNPSSGAKLYLKVEVKNTSV